MAVWALLSFAMQTALVVLRRVALSETIFTAANLGPMLVVLLVLAGFSALLHPPRERTLAVSAETLARLAPFEAPLARPRRRRPSA